MSVDPRHHRHFVSRKADLLRQISEECGAVSIVFPRASSKSDRVVLTGAKQCVDAARQRILDIVAELVSTLRMMSFSVFLLLCVRIATHPRKP